MDSNRYYGGGNSSSNSHDDPGPIPDRWLDCPRISNSLIADKFLAFKTPLSARFSPKMEPKYHFPPDMVFSYIKMEKKKLGLWIDLTNTKRFYDRRDIEARDCQYIKLKCRGHGETPSLEQTESFIQFVDDCMREHPLELIGVHCTHGFNRTGFLIVSYMVERMDCAVEAAIAAFAASRPPGIYKQDYINELYRRYDDEDDASPAPELPTWCLEYDDGDGNESHEQYGDYNYSSASQQSTSPNKRKHEKDSSSHDPDDEINDQSVEPNDGESSTSSDNLPKKKRRKEFANPNAKFMDGIQGVRLVTDQPRLGKLQETIQKMCKFESSGFPGSQPVSMDVNNIQMLHDNPYRVSWKADGTRYMMLILKENEVYFFDRDNSCFQVSGIRFPCRDELNTHIFETLIDGEMVIDKVNGLSIPRYLVYDIVSYNGTDYMEYEFWSDTLFSRLKCIRENIIEPRHQAMQCGMINKQREPFSVRDKSFWDVTQAKKLLEPKFTKTLGHEPDGLIFQPCKDPYIPGQCNVVLKWKPPHQNSVDFKLKIGTESGAGILTKKVGYLYVGGLETPFSQIKLNSELKLLDNKIIECTFQNNQWALMRERQDKSFPNSYKTALAVCESIKSPVTAELLEDYIERCRYKELMPPPRSLPRHF